MDVLNLDQPLFALRPRVNQEKEDLETGQDCLFFCVKMPSLWSLLRVDPESEALVLYAAGTVFNWSSGQGIADGLCALISRLILESASEGMLEAHCPSINVRLPSIWHDFENDKKHLLGRVKGFGLLG